MNKYEKWGAQRGPQREDVGGLVGAQSVKIFQKRLQKQAQLAACSHIRDW